MFNCLICFIDCVYVGLIFFGSLHNLVAIKSKTSVGGAREIYHGASSFAVISLFFSTIVTKIKCTCHKSISYVSWVGWVSSSDAADSVFVTFSCAWNKLGWSHSSTSANLFACLKHWTRHRSGIWIHTKFFSNF